MGIIALNNEADDYLCAALLRQSKVTVAEIMVSVPRQDMITRPRLVPQGADK